MSAPWRRWRRPGVRSLSVFDLDLRGTPLWRRLGQPRVDALRAARVPEQRIGAELAATTQAALRELRARHAFERAFVAGGLTLLDGFAARLRDSAGVPLQVCDDGAFVGERGGRALLGHPARGLVADVGQTAIKLSSSERRLLRARDASLLPLELVDPGGAPPRPEPQRLSRAAEFIGAAIAELGAPGDRWVLALPCPLDDACVPGPCSYGWQDEARLVPAIVERSRLAPCEVLVLNDAELAAETALLDCRPPLLVLTLGFGPGAALVTGSAL